MDTSKVTISRIGKDGDNETLLETTGGDLKALAGGLRLNEIRAAIPELEAAAGGDAGVIKTFITARVNETVAKTERRAEQLGLLFDEIA